jgi:hypothetical protein
MLLVVGLLAAGCGGSSSDSTATLTKSQFLTQANAICSKGNRQLASAEETLGTEASPSQFKSYVAHEWAPAVQNQIDGIEALEAPSADQDTVSNMLEIAQQDLNKVKSDPMSLTNESFASFAKLAHPYGLTDCAPTS